MGGPLGRGLPLRENSGPVHRSPVSLVPQSTEALGHAPSLAIGYVPQQILARHPPQSTEALGLSLLCAPSAFTPPVAPTASPIGSGGPQSIPDDLGDTAGTFRNSLTNILGVN